MENCLEAKDPDLPEMPLLLRDTKDTFAFCEELAI